MSREKVAAAFAQQAINCADLGSPFMERLCALLATRDWPDTALTARVMSWSGDLGPSAQSTPLRLCGGLHALALKGSEIASAYPPNEADDETLWDHIRQALDEQEAFLDNWIDNPPQTNEVRRAAAIIAAANLIGARYDLPFRISELGASGGLNLMWDRFALVAPGKRYGPPDAALILTPDWTGGTPPMSDPVVAERRGVDLNPLDPRDPHDALRLRAYLWPDQPERMARTEAAIAVNTAEVDQAEAIDWLKPRLEHVPGRVHMIYHTVAWQYFPRDKQEEGRAAIEEAGRFATKESPLAWLGMEAATGVTGAQITLRLWPGDETLALGRIDFHGRWMAWEHA